MISINDLRAGRTFQIDGIPFQTIEYKHTKVGRGSASIRIKAKNLKSGVMFEKTFVSGAKVEEVDTEFKLLQYLYRDDDNFCFIDNKDFNQYSLAKGVFDDKEKFLKEGINFKVLFWNDKPLLVEFPLSMVFEVAQTTPGVKGNSVVASFKPATLDNGLAVKVPLFVNVGDKIKIDTRSGVYLERAN